MAHLLWFVLFHFIIHHGKASVFLGGSVSYFVGQQSQDGSVEVNLYHREYRGQSCVDQLSWQCENGDCGTPTTSEVLVSNTSSSGIVFCQSEFYAKRKVLTNSPFTMSDSGCCWRPNMHGTNSWAMSTVVDVATRSDTGKPNRSPISAVVARLRMPQNCFEAMELLAHDPDGDEVRCRFAVKAGANCSSCHTHPDIIIDQELCVLRRNGSLSVGTHLFELILEDYPSKDITITYTDGTSAMKYHLNTTGFSNVSPLSQTPLQFTLEVLPPVVSCSVGFRPVFLPPTPSHEEVHITAIGHVHRMKIRAQSTDSRIVDFQISGPANMTKSVRRRENGIVLATVEWTAPPSSLHHSIPVCFTADTATSQSDMRCVVLLVMESQPLSGEGEVSCEENRISIAVSRSSIPRINHRWLHMNDPSCSLTSNGTHVMGTITINTCGTQMEEDTNFIIFRNSITSFDEPGSVITRRGQVSIDFSCQYPKVVNVHSHYLNQKSDYIFTEASFGSFGYTFEVFTDSNFSTAIALESYPVEYQLMEMIYMGIKSHSSLPNTKLFVESCRATPSVNPKSTLHYDIISNGCMIDETLKKYPNVPTAFNFEIQAFKFNGDSEEVYISCSVILCEADNPNSRCAQGCVNSTPQRRKRVSSLETNRHFITQGPFRISKVGQNHPGGEMVSRLDTKASSTLHTSVSTAVVASLLVASVITLAGLLYYRHRTYRTISQQNLVF